MNMKFSILIINANYTLLYNTKRLMKRNLHLLNQKDFTKVVFGHNYWLEQKIINNIRIFTMWIKRRIEELLFKLK